MILLLTGASLSQPLCPLKPLTETEREMKGTERRKIPYLLKLSGNIFRKIKEKAERSRRE